MKAAIASYRKLLALLPVEARRFLTGYSVALGLLAILDAISLGLLAVVITPLVTNSPITLPLLGTVEGFGLVVLLGIVCALIILKGVLSLALTWFATRRFARYELIIGNQLLDSYLRSSWSARLRRNSSDLVRIADIGIANTIAGFLLPGATLLGEALTFFTVVVVLAVAQPLIAAITLVYFGLVGAVMFFWISPRAQLAGRVGMRSSLRVSRLITEMVGALKEITLRNKAAEVAGVVRETRVETARARANIYFLNNVPRYILESALVGGFVLVGVAGFVAGEITGAGGMTQAVTGISLFALAGFRMMPSVQRFQAVTTQVISNIPLADAVIDDIHAARSAPHQDIPVSVRELAAQPSSLSFHDVGFSYSPEAPPAVSGVNLKIRFGSSVAIVGSSGAGKSTLIDLLLGLIEPTTGVITIDDVPISEVTTSWHSRVGYVPQEVSLFDGSIAQNVALSWTTDFDRERVLAALEQAQLLPTIEARFGGIDGSVGERGLSLSGGQRQRLGIARALYAQPLVLVMDEATSSLDTATEAAVSDAIRTLHGRVTTVTVAHRLATIQHADQIFFMTGGRVAAQGTFDELVAQVPEFAYQAALAGLTDRDVV